MSTEKNNFFISFDQVEQHIINETGTNEFLKKFLNDYLLLCIKDKIKKTEYVFKDDLPFYLRLAKLNSNISQDYYEKFGYANNMFSTFLKISDNTAVYISDYSKDCQIPAFVRNLFYYNVLLENHPAQLEATSSEFDLMGVMVITYESQIKEYMKCVIKRKQEIDQVRSSNFTNTAFYMGNKRKISGFIVEALFPHVSSNCSFIDLMCGSGSISRVFAHFGATYASDAQDFCRLLAKIQGKGFTKDRAIELLDKLTFFYKQNYHELEKRYQEQLDKENALYHRDWADKTKIFLMYNDYVTGFELYSSTESISDQLTILVNEYKNNIKKYPYCLFTLYYSNVFFGLHQCIQLDSIRYAIDQFSEEEREWALGVLIVTTSQISSGHANHFAQPKKITENNITDILIKRQKSAYHEFSKRLICLAEESQTATNKIKLLPGPWKNALDFSIKNISGEKIVYLDAPYKRDEYSRYYHVLETIVKYDYPSSEFKGRLRSKKLKERFATEFFTKTSSNIEKIFVKIITSILFSNMKCVWSYSDNGEASIINIINEVINQIPCTVNLYGIPYNHQSQRGNNHKISVTEYCIVFCPMK